METSSSVRAMTPSLTRKPAARSKSAPGVLIVTAIDRPLTRSSSGSSPASVSFSRTGVDPTVIRTTLRTGDIRLTGSPRLCKKPASNALEYSQNQFLASLTTRTFYADGVLPRLARVARGNLGSRRYTVQREYVGRRVAQRLCGAT